MATVRFRPLLGASALALVLTSWALLSPAPAAGRQEQPAGDNLVLVTLDGVRTEEIFGGLDLAVLESTLKKGAAVEGAEAYRRFHAATRDERRRRLMPFFWTLVTEHGSIAGDATLGSAVRLKNRHWFSYPGYAEILLGRTYDEVIKSNDPIRNPYPTVLEGLREHLGLPPGKVATFASWGVFDAIVEHREGATFANAAVEPVGGGDAETRLLNTLQAEARTPWDGTRFDAFTFRHAMGYLARERPRVLYLAFDETDDWAHDGRYERVLDTLARTDDYLRELWTWLQAQPDYRGRTHLLLTTDHGRGRTLQDWRSHGAKVAGAEDVWIAFVSPRMAQRGPWQRHEALSTSQIAATVASWLGLDWQARHPDAGAPIR